MFFLLLSRDVLIWYVIDTVYSDFMPQEADEVVLYRVVQTLIFYWCMSQEKRVWVKQAPLVMAYDGYCCLFCCIYMRVLLSVWWYYPYCNPALRANEFHHDITESSALLDWWKGGKNCHNESTSFEDSQFSTTTSSTRKQRFDAPIEDSLGRRAYWDYAQKTKMLSSWAYYVRSFIHTAVLYVPNLSFSVCRMDSNRSKQATMNTFDSIKLLTLRDHDVLGADRPIQIALDDDRVAVLHVGCHHDKLPHNQNPFRISRYDPGRDRRLVIWLLFLFHRGWREYWWSFFCWGYGYEGWRRTCFVVAVWTHRSLNLLCSPEWLPPSKHIVKGRTAKKAPPPMSVEVVGCKFGCRLRRSSLLTHWTSNRPSILLLSERRHEHQGGARVKISSDQGYLVVDYVAGSMAFPGSSISSINRCSRSIRWGITRRHRKSVLVATTITTYPSRTCSQE